MNITIQWQVNESWDLNNYLTVFIQGDACHLVADIKVGLITHYENEKMQSKFTPYSRSKPSTSYQKKIANIETDHLLVETEQVQVDQWRASKMYHQNMPYHSIPLNSYAKSNRNTKRSYKHCQEGFMDIYATRLFHTPELVSLS